jgi:hypothetical protein
VLAYLMLDRGMNLKDALDHVRARRTIAEPNPGFMIQLKAFEKVIFGVLSDCPIILNKKAPEGKDASTKEVTDGIEQLKIKGDEDGARDIEEQLHQAAEGSV